MLDSFALRSSLAVAGRLDAWSAKDTPWILSHAAVPVVYAIAKTVLASMKMLRDLRDSSLCVLQCIYARRPFQECCAAFHRSMSALGNTPVLLTSVDKATSIRRMAWHLFSEPAVMVPVAPLPLRDRIVDAAKGLPYFLYYAAVEMAGLTRWHTVAHAAIAGRCYSIAKRMILSGADIHARDFRGEALLHKAVRRGNIEMLEWLKQHGADLEARKSTGITPLDLAVILEKFDVIEKLVAMGADINTGGPDDRAAIHWAVCIQNVEIVEWLIKQGANVEARDMHALTPLHMAVLMEADDVVEKLIALGANPNAPDGDGQTVLHWAVRCLDIKLLERLVKLGADINAVDKQGRTPLLYANGRYSTALIEKLLDLGAR